MSICARCADMAVNAVKEQSHKVLGAAVFLAVFNGTEESLVLVKLVLVSNLGNVGQLLINDVTMPICMCCADMRAIQICLHCGQSAKPYHPVTHHVPPQHCTKKSGKSAAPNHCGIKPSRRSIVSIIITHTRRICNRTFLPFLSVVESLQ